MISSRFAYYFHLLPLVGSSVGIFYRHRICLLTILLASSAYSLTIMSIFCFSHLYEYKNDYPHFRLSYSILQLVWYNTQARVDQSFSLLLLTFTTTTAVKNPYMV